MIGPWRTKPPLGSRLATGHATRGLVSAWLVNEGSGSVLHDLCGRNDLTLTNMDPGTDWVGSSRGRALDLDGSNDYAQTTAPRGLPVGRAPRTVCMWVRLANTDPGGILFTYGNTVSGGLFCFQIAKSVGTQYLFSDNASNVLTITGAEIPSAAEWHHLAFAFDGDSTWYYYIDGRLAKTGTFGTAINTAAPNVLRIGEFTAVPSGFALPGRVGLTSLYARALGLAEIRRLAVVDQYQIIARPSALPFLGSIPPALLGFANPQPADGALLVDTSTVSVEAYPVDPGDTITSPTAEIDGVSYTPTMSTIGVLGGKRLTVSGLPRRLGRTRSVTFGASVDSDTRTISWSYTERPKWGATHAPADYIAQHFPTAGAPVDYLFSSSPALRVPTDYILGPSGLLRSTPVPVDYVTAPSTSGVLGYVPIPTDFLTTQMERAWGPAIGCHVTYPDDQPLSVGAMIESTDRYHAPSVGAHVTSTDRQHMASVGASIVLAERQWAAAVGAMVSLAERQPLSVGAQIRGIIVSLLLTYRLRSKKMQDVDRGDL